MLDRSKEKSTAIPERVPLFQTALHSRESSHNRFPCLNQELFNLDLHTIDSRLELRGFICSDGARNHGAGNTTSTSKGYLARNKDVRNVFVLTQQGQMKKNLN